MTMNLIRRWRLAAAALSVLAAPELPAAENGLLARWSFDETTGSVALDASGSGHDARIHGVVRRVPGVRGSALAFPGEKDSYAACPNPDGDLNLTSSLTLAAWVRRTDTGTLWDGILCNAGDRTGFQLFYGEKGQNLVLYLNTDAQGYGPVTGRYLPLERWTHVAATYDSARRTVELYQDGERTASQPWRGTITGFGSELLIGRSDRSNAFRGELDEVRIYGRALGAEEIRELYRADAPAGEGAAAASPPPPSCFRDLKATFSEGRSRVELSFAKTDEFLAEASGASTETQVVILRGSHPRNDATPGARSAVEVFRGKLSSPDNRTYTWTDELTPEPGRSYFYWVSPDGENLRVLPAKVRSYSPEIWWSPETVEQRVQGIAAAFPDQVKIQCVGKTAQGHPLHALLAGNPDRRVVVIGAIHVSESGPELILPAVEGLLREQPDLLKEVGLAVLPCVTLDERERMLATGWPLYLRKNARSVDLNRNFPAWWDEVSTGAHVRTDDPASETWRGPSPASEPETQAVMTLLKEANPVAGFSFHCLASMCSAAFVYTNYTVRDGDTTFTQVCESVARTYADGMYEGEGAKYYWTSATGSPGSLGSYLYKEYRAPSFDLELDRNEQLRAVIYADSVTPELLREYQLRHQKALEAVLRGFAEGKLGGEGKGKPPERAEAGVSGR